MGQIRTIIGATRVAPPESNTAFSIKHVFGRIDIHYRNVRIALPRADFVVCARELRRLSKPQVTQHMFGSGTFVEALSFLGIDASFPGADKIRLERRGGSRELNYRCLRISLREAEAAFAARQLARPPRTIWARLSTRLAVGLRLKSPPPDAPLLKKRLSVDLCENIHVHYQNLRFEFSREEFMCLWEAVAGLDLDRLPVFGFGTLCSSVLPAATEWDDRLQLEEQVEGHYHLHYRNLRVEFRDFAEIGLDPGNGSMFVVDQKYRERFIQPRNWTLAGVRSVPLAQLNAIVFDPEGSRVVPLAESPIYRALQNDDRQIYDRYAEIVRRHDPAAGNDWPRFQSLLRSIRAGHYDQNSVIVTKGEQNEIVDGQHRACILLWLHGAEKLVKTAHYR
jgi:hypothetical protein